MPEQVLIIGGNAAGMTAASRAKRLRPDISVTILEASRHISYSICGLPYYVAGKVSRFEDLVHFTPESLLNQRSIWARTETRAVEILPSRRSVLVEEPRSLERRLVPYDKLLIATGYRPVRPSWLATGAQGVFTASRIEDGQAIVEWLADPRRRRAVVVGGGYIGVEMAEALRRRGLAVTLVEKERSVLPGFDPEMAAGIEREIVSNGVQVLTGQQVGSILTRSCGAVDAVKLDDQVEVLPADIVFVDVGVRPEVEAAAAAGIHLGPSGAIAVTDRMETNIASIYAAGNCAETVHRVTGRPVVDPLGTVAVKQGRVAGENMAGRVSRFRGVVGTSVVKAFDLCAARTGLSAAEARQEGFRVAEARVESRFRASYVDDGGIPGTVKVIADGASHRLLGAQIVGGEAAVLRIDVLATAITEEMSVEDAAQLDLAYTPSLGALWNPVLIAMNALIRNIEGREPHP